MLPLVELFAAGTEGVYGKNIEFRFASIRFPTLFSRGLARFSVLEAH